MEIELLLKAHVYPPFESITHTGERNDKIFLIKQGLVSQTQDAVAQSENQDPNYLSDGVTQQSALFGRGSVLCESALFSDHQVHTSSLSSLTYVHVFALDQQDFRRALSVFPKEAQLIRKRAIRGVFREEVLAYTRAAQLVEKPTSISNVVGFANPRLKHYYEKIKLLHRETRAESIRMLLLTKRIQRRARAYLRRKRERGELKSQGVALEEERNTLSGVLKTLEGHVLKMKAEMRQEIADSEARILEALNLALKSSGGA